METHKKSLGKDQGGILGLSITMIIALVAGVVGLGVVSTIDMTFLLAILVMCIIGISVVAYSMGRISNFMHVIIIAFVCVGIVMILEVGAVTAAGLAVIGGGVYYFGGLSGSMFGLSFGSGGGNRQVGMFMIMLGLGSLLVIWGAKFVLVPMGIVP